MKWTEFATREARRTLTEWERRSGKLKPPIAVEDIADLLYLLSIDTTDSLPVNVAGRLYVEDRIIEVKKTDIPTRQRFTIAHEVGHHQLHVIAEKALQKKYTCNGDTIRDVDTTDLPLFPGLTKAVSSSPYSSGIDSRRLEIEANTFAAEILMPVLLMEDCVGRYGPDVRNLASLFDVSQQAMRYRLEKLLLLPPSGPQTTFL